MTFALLTPDLTTIQTYPLTKTMVRKKAVMGSLVTMTSSATDITSISTRIVAVQENPQPAASEAYEVAELPPVKDGGGIWQQTWTTTPNDAGQITTKLNNLKRTTLDQVLQTGQDLRSGNFLIGGGAFDLSGDGFTRVVLMGTVAGARTVPIGPDGDGIAQYFDATGPQIATLVADISAFIDAIAAKESALRDLIAAATTLAELQAIDIVTGWPANS